MQNHYFPDNKNPTGNGDVLLQDIKSVFGKMVWNKPGYLNSKFIEKIRSLFNLSVSTAEIWNNLTELCRSYNEVPEKTSWPKKLYETETRDPDFDLICCSIIERHLNQGFFKNQIDSLEKLMIAHQRRVIYHIFAKDQYRLKDELPTLENFLQLDTLLKESWVEYLKSCKTDLNLKIQANDKLQNSLRDFPITISASEILELIETEAFKPEGVEENNKTTYDLLTKQRYFTASTIKQLLDDINKTSIAKKPADILSELGVYGNDGLSSREGSKNYIYYDIKK